MTDATFVEPFVGFNLVSIFVSHSDQEETPLPAVYCYLADSLIEALVVELLTDGADTNLLCSFVKETLIKFFLQLDDLYFGGRGGENSLNPELSIIGFGFLGRQNLS